MVTARDLTIGYRGSAVVKEIGLTVGMGETIVLIGHNGAGKTTLLRTLFGLLPPVAGRFEVLGQGPEHARPETLLLRGGRYLGQGDRGFGDLRVEQSRDVLSTLYGFEDGSPDLGVERRDARISELSAGQQRLEAIRLLSAGDPDLYLLDEPLSGIDAGVQKRIVEWISNTGRECTFLIVEHEFEPLAPVADRCLVLNDGEVVFDGSERILTDEEQLRKHYL